MICHSVFQAVQQRSSSGVRIGGLYGSAETALVCLILPEPDLKNVRLVNKQWSGIAVNVLWSYLTIDLAQCCPLRPFLNPTPGDVLENIKELEITSPPQARLDPLLARKATSNLLALMGALLSDSLLDFRMPHYQIDRNTLRLLLRNQSQLNSLRVSSSQYEQDGLPGPNSISMWI